MELDLYSQGDLEAISLLWIGRGSGDWSSLL